MLGSRAGRRPMLADGEPRPRDQLQPAATARRTLLYDRDDVRLCSVYPTELRLAFCVCWSLYTGLGPKRYIASQWCTDGFWYPEDSPLASTLRPTLLRYRACHSLPTCAWSAVPPRAEALPELPIPEIWTKGYSTGCCYHTIPVTTTTTTTTTDSAERCLCIPLAVTSIAQHGPRTTTVARPHTATRTLPQSKIGLWTLLGGSAIYQADATNNLRHQRDWSPHRVTAPNVG